MNIALNPKYYSTRLSDLVSSACDLQRCGRTIVALCEPTCAPLTHVEVQELQNEATSALEVAARIIRQAEGLGLLDCLADSGAAPERKEKTPRIPKVKGKKLLTKKELAKAFSVCEGTIHRWMREGAPHVIVGATDGKKCARRYDPAKVKSWLDGRQGRKEATNEND